MADRCTRLPHANYGASSRLFTSLKLSVQEFSLFNWIGTNKLLLIRRGDMQMDEAAVVDIWIGGLQTKNGYSIMPSCLPADTTRIL